MDRIRVTSSNIASIGYDPLYYLLEVEFCDGAVYHYARVPSHIHQALMDADSKGTFFLHHIRDRYPTTKISDGTKDRARSDDGDDDGPGNSAGSRATSTRTRR